MYVYEGSKGEGLLKWGRRKEGTGERVHLVVFEHTHSAMGNSDERHESHGVTRGVPAAPRGHRVRSARPGPALLATSGLRRPSLGGRAGPRGGSSRRSRPLTLLVICKPSFQTLASPPPLSAVALGFPEGPCAVGLGWAMTPPVKAPNSHPCRHLRAPAF